MKNCTCYYFHDIITDKDICSVDILLDKKKFVHIEIEKKKFYCNNTLMFLLCVDFEKVLVSNNG